MAEDFELFNAPAAKESSDQSDEKFSEEMRKTQAALAQLQKEEGQSKTNDDRLAQIIIQFLSKPEYTDLFLLISRCVAQNIHSELILAVLSLIDKAASEEVNLMLRGKETSTGAIAVKSADGFEKLLPEQKKAMDKWISSIRLVAAKNPYRTLGGILIMKKSTQPADMGKMVFMVSDAIVQLAAIILRNFLSGHGTIEFDAIHEFMEAVFVELVKTLEALVQDQKKISKNG